MSVMVKTKETVCTGETGPLRIQGTIRQLDRYQTLSIDARMGSGQVVLLILNRFVDHLIGQGNGRVALLERAGACRPSFPVNITAPGHAQNMAHQDSQCANCLTKLPITGFWVSPRVLKPPLHGFGRVRAQSNAWMVCQEPFDMTPILRNGIYRDSKMPEQFGVFCPMTLNSWIKGWIMSFHMKKLSLLRLFGMDTYIELIST
jgi:hypothetical protein